MADRRQSFTFRFWPTRRSQTPSPPPATTNSPPAARPTPQSRPVSRQRTTTNLPAPPPAETQSPSRPPLSTNLTPAARPTSQSRPVSRQTTTTNPASTTSPKPDTQTPSQPPAPISKPTVESKADGTQSTTTNPISTKPTSPTQTLSQPPEAIKPAPISTPTPEPQADHSQSSISTTMPPPTTEKISARAPNSNSSPPPTPSLSYTTPLEQKTRAGSPQKISPQHETKTSSPSTPIKPASLSNPASPAPPPNQSKSPPQTSSPSRPAPQPLPITPKRASQTRSLSRSTSKNTSSNSPKKPPNSPSNKPNLEAPQQELQPKAEPKSNNAANNDIDGVEKTVSKSTQHGNTVTKTQNELLPPENLASSIVNGEHEPLPKLKAGPEETTYVKEVVQAIENKADENRKREANSIPNPMSSSEGSTPSKEKPEVLLKTKETLPTSLPSLEPTSNTASQPKKIVSTVSGIRDKAAQENGEHISSNKDIKNDVSKFLNGMALGDPKNALNEKNVSIITLAGENRGASMQMGPTAQKDGPVHISRGYKVSPGEIADTTNNGEESSKGKPSDDAKATEGQPTEAYVNNNTQGINNSIVFNASIAQRNPGVHLAVTHVPKDSIWSAEKISPAEARKAEYNMTQAEKVTYDPLVRRRCLRGLLLETSGSDIENPEKPRRHGCRVGCQQKEKENNADIS